MSLYQFDCGHVLSISHTGELPDMPCPTCAEIENAKKRPSQWIEGGAECKAKRRQAFRQDKKRYSYRGIADQLGVTVSVICSMERGDVDPAPLVEFWSEFINRIDSGEFNKYWEDVDNPVQWVRNLRE